MAEADRQRWDERYATKAPPSMDAVGPPGFLAAHLDVLPTAGRALDVACGPGPSAVWLALRGLEVVGVDVSPVAVGQARELAQRAGVSDRCRFEVADLDDGLPAGPPVDLVLCHRFRDRRLDRLIIERLAPGGLLAITVLSEVGAAPGPYRAAAGELPAAFAELEQLAAGEGEGQAWLLARAGREGR
ncbi:bifunctional 2-polyprenyl-6-hydroxyphenol methylase/3-demethylubiquinol 3-O-methyltransferase UbiG [Mycobacterium sp. E2238]|uniref:class I SAM-dependent methyltransferase n=1 Tax=Mycobacterium sp. E2238 TaxID=1834131 RepID=UPI00080073F9|nr:class I SAM-dependent methyltransferase [Mycobacterium sp. E2238]OBI37901.1 SAM-dependent methyltransferase [Mycobacterium sp. E2238]